MIVDCHTHWGAEWQERDGLEPMRWLREFDRHGVTHAIVLPHLGLIDAGNIPSDNDAVATVCAKSKGRMLPFCTVNIWQPETALSELSRCLEQLNFRGIKFHPWLQGCSVSDPVMDQVADVAGTAGVPVFFHDGTPPFSLPSQIALLAKRHPKTQIVLGHTGLFEHWRESIAAIQSTPNVWGCMCSPHLAALKAILQGSDLSRLIWGSDQGWALNDFIDYRLSLMDCLGLTDQQHQAIFSENPRRLLGI